jgi:hypothetical protein
VITAEPLGSIHLVAVREGHCETGLGCLDYGGDRRRDPGNPGRSRNAPPSPQPRSGFQGPLPLAGVQRAGPSGGVQGQRPWPPFTRRCGTG